MSIYDTITPPDDWEVQAVLSALSREPDGDTLAQALGLADYDRTVRHPLHPSDLRRARPHKRAAELGLKGRRTL